MIIRPVFRSAQTVLRRQFCTAQCVAHQNRVMVHCVASSQTDSFDIFLDNLKTSGASIGEAKFITVGNMFTLLAEVSIPSSTSAKQFEGKLISLTNDAESIINVRPFTNPAPPKPATNRVRFHFDAPDQPGLVKAVTEMLRTKKCIISELESDTYPAPYAGNQMFHMRCELVLPQKTTIDDLYSALLPLEDELGAMLELSAVTKVKSEHHH